MGRVDGTRRLILHYRLFFTGIKAQGGRNVKVGLLKRTAEIVEELKRNGERATPEAVIALATWEEGGKKDGGSRHEQREGAEIT